MRGEKRVRDDSVRSKALSMDLFKEQQKMMRLIFQLSGIKPSRTSKDIKTLGASEN